MEQEQPHDPSEPSFRLDDFKKWMESQQGPPLSRRPERVSEMVGTHVVPKLQSKRLVSKIVVEEGDVMDVARDFKRNGGTVVRVDSHCLIIEVDAGTFSIPRLYVTKAS